MRLSCFLACWLTLFCLRDSLFPQQKLVNLKVVAESLSNVLMQIKDQTGVKILYNENLLKNYENINLDLNNVEVEEALRQVLANTRFEYEVTDGVIVVKEKKNSFPQQKTVRIQGKSKRRGRGTPPRRNGFNQRHDTGNCNRYGWKIFSVRPGR